MLPEILIGIKPGPGTFAPTTVVAAKPAHLQMVDRIILSENDGSGVRPIFKQQFIIPQQRVEMSAVISAQPAPQYQKLCPFYGPNRIDLKTANRP